MNMNYSDSLKELIRRNSLYSVKLLVMVQTHRRHYFRVTHHIFKGDRSIPVNDYNKSSNIKKTEVQKYNGYWRQF